MNPVPTLQFDPEAEGIHVDLSQLVTSRALIQANSGGGKSWMLRYILEQTHGRIQHIVIDPEGEFASLRERFDYLLAGRDGDVPADPFSAHVLCRRVMELGVSLIVDLSELDRMDRLWFVGAFIGELMELPRELWHPALIVIDEAHDYAAQRGSNISKEMTELEHASRHAVASLASKGRKRGFSALLATQRLSKLHKDVAAELLNKIIGRTGLDVDVKRAAEELGFEKERRQEMKFLEPGTFFTYGPAIAQEVIRVRSGAITTSHPEAGEIAPPAPPAPAAIRELVSHLQDLQREAEEEARTLEELHAKLAAAEERVRMLEAAPPAGVSDRKAIETAIADATAAAERRFAEQFEGAQREHRTIERQLRTLLADCNARVARIAEVISAPAQAADVAQPLHATPAASEPGPISPPEKRPRREPLPPASANSADPGRLTGKQQELLNAIAFYESIGIAEPTVLQVAAAIGVNRKKSTWRGILAGLRARKLIEERGELMSLTEDGHALARAPLSPPTLADLHRVLIARVSGPAGAILRELIKHRPRSFSRDQLASMIGTRKEISTWRGVMAELRREDLVLEDDPDSISVAEWLFPEGLL